MTFARVATQLTACWLAGLLACTSTETQNFRVGPDGGVTQFGVSKSIGTQGGSLEVTDPNNPAFGAGIDVPPGALAENTTITIGPDARPAAAPYGLRTVGPAVDFGPPGAVFSLAPTITMPYQLDPASGERLVVLQLAKGGTTRTMAAGAAGTSGPGGWTVLEAQLSTDGSRRVTVTSLQLGLFIVAAVGNGVGLPDGGVVGPDGSIIAGGDGGSALPDGGVRPTDHTPPTFAGLVAAELDTQMPGQAKLTWDLATDDQTPQAAIRYRLYLPSFATIGAAQFESPPGVTNLTLPVSPGVTYYFLVRAVDAAGNEDSNFNIKSLDVPTGGPILGNLGDACQQGTDCQSNSCADGVCCENACTGSCTYCNGAGRPGRCDPAKVGTDPRAACTGAAAGQVLLCDAQQKCTLCQPVGSTEICNNGVDDNGDDLVDFQDPACAVCAPPRVLCTTQNPSFVAFPDTTTMNTISASGIAWNGSEFGVGINSQPPAVDTPFPIIANLRRYSPSGAILGETAIQTTNDTSTYPSPAVVVNGAGFAMGFSQNTTAELFQLVGGDGVAVGSSTPVGMGGLQASNSGLATASMGGGFGFSFSQVTNTENSEIDFAHITAAGAISGTVIALDSPGTPEQVSIPIIVDNSDTLDFTVAYLHSPGKAPTQARAVRIGYGATTPSILPTDLTNEPLGLYNSLALGSLGTNNLLSYVRNTATGAELVAQLFDGSFTPIGTPLVLSTNMTPDTVLGVAVNGTAGMVIWSSAGKVLATRLDLSTARGAGATIGAGSTMPLNTFSNQRSLPSADTAAVTSTGTEGGFGVAFNTDTSFDSVVFETLCDPRFPPANNACANAIPVTLGTAITGTTAAASVGGFPACTSGGRSVFYKITLAQGDSIVPQVTPTLGGFAAVAVAASCTPAVDSCFSSAGAAGTSVGTFFTAPQDGDYLISVEVGEGSQSGPGTDFILSIESPVS